MAGYLRRVVRSVAVGSVLLGGAACAPGGDDATTVDRAAGTTIVAPATSTSMSTADPLAGRPFQVETWTEPFVDTSRPTDPGATTPGSADRSLPTVIRLPDADEPRPLIVFAHGLSGHPDRFTGLLSTWAEAGYVVAAPAFPLTNRTVEQSGRNLADLVNQPADVTFVIDEVLRLSEDPTSPLYGRVDADRIGAGGLSLGGATTYALTYDGCCRDDRVVAAEVLAGALLPIGDEYHVDGHVPLLVVHGTADPVIPYGSAVGTVGAAEPPVWFVTLEGGGHAPPFQDEPTPHDEVAEQVTTDFWDATLGRDPDGFDRLGSDAVVDGLSHIDVAR